MPKTLEAALDQVSSRKPYANHWGQRLLGFSHSPLRHVLGELDPLILLGVNVVLAGVALLFSLTLHIAWNIIPLTLLIISLRAVAWNLSSAPLSKEQLVRVHSWMVDNPALTEAAGHWVRSGETLRQRDYRLLKKGLHAIQSWRALETLLARGDKNSHPLSHWAELSRQLIANFPKTFTPPSDLSGRPLQRVQALLDRLKSIPATNDIHVSGNDAIRILEMHPKPFYRDFFTSPIQT